MEGRRVSESEPPAEPAAGLQMPVEGSPRSRWLSARFNAACGASRALAGRSALGGSWQQVPGDEQRALRGLQDSKAVENVPSICVCMRKELPFYPGHRLYKFLRVGITSGLRAEHFAASGTAITKLDRSGRSIPGLNATVPLRLDEHTILDYLYFFFAFRHGRHGRFLLVECVDDLRFAAATDAATREAIAGLIRPVSIVRADANGGGGAFAADCTFVFRSSLFSCPVTIAATGDVQMGDEHLLLSDLDVTVADHVT